jgi:hypothetical protein
MTGFIDGKQMDKPNPETVILCLRVDLLQKSMEWTLLKKLAESCEVAEIVREAVEKWGWNDRYPKVGC